MSRAGKTEKVVALAMTWDGARVPVRTLSTQAKTFLRDGSAPAPGKVAELLRDGAVKEIRICWVPRLSGSKETLALPLQTADGKRVDFRAMRQVPLGQALGVVYRRN